MGAFAASLLLAGISRADAAWRRSTPATFLDDYHCGSFDVICEIEMPSEATPVEERRAIVHRLSEEALSSKSGARNAQAAELLRLPMFRFAAPEAIPILRLCLREPATRIAAARSLLVLDPDHTDALLEPLVAQLRVEPVDAIDVIGEIAEAQGPGAAAAVQALRAVLLDRQAGPSARERALTRLLESGERSRQTLDAIAESAMDPEPRLWVEAAAWLGAWPRPEAKAKHPFEGRRWRGFAVPAPPLLPVLRLHARDKSVASRCLAAAHWLALEPRSAAAVEVLGACLEEKGFDAEHWRGVAAAALAGSPEAGRAALPKLIAAARAELDRPGVEATSELLAALGSLGFGDPEAMRILAEALGFANHRVPVGPGLEDEIVEGWRVRAKALEALSAMGAAARPLVPAFRRHLARKEAGPRCAAAAAWAGVEPRSAEARAALARCLNEEDPELRELVENAIARAEAAIKPLAPAAGKALPFRLAHLGDCAAETEIGERYLRGEGVPRDGVKSLKWILRAARSGYGPAMRAAARAYAEPGPLQDLRQAAIWEARAAVVPGGGLCEWRRFGPKEFGVLAELEAFEAMGSNSAGVLHRIAAGIADEDGAVRAAAQEFLSRMGTAAAPALPVLRRLAASSEAGDRCAAAEVWLGIEPDSRRALRTIKRCLGEKAPLLRESAARALARAGAAADAVPELIEALSRGPRPIYAALALGTAGPPAAGAVGPLLEVYERWRSSSAAQTCGGGFARPRTAEFFDEDLWIAPAAAKALAEIGTPTAVAGLRPRAEAGDRWAAWALGEIYADGRGVPRDEDSARRWLTVPLRQGGPIQAASRLALLGATVDTWSPPYLLNIGAMGGDCYGLYRYARHLWETGRRAEAFPNIKTAALKGYGPAMRDLVKIYLQEGLWGDSEKAKLWTARAASALGEGLCEPGRYGPSWESQ